MRRLDFSIAVASQLGTQVIDDDEQHVGTFGRDACDGDACSASRYSNQYDIPQHWLSISIWQRSSS